VTREQQIVDKELQAVQSKWLLVYGWEPIGKHWRHPKLQLDCKFTALDAIAQTLAMPHIGWPHDRYTASK